MLELGFRLVLGFLVVSSGQGGPGKGKGKEKWKGQVTKLEKCPSGRLFLGSLSESIHADHIPNTGIYHSLDGAKHNKQPVFKHTSRETFIYFLSGKSYGNGLWAVGPEVGSLDFKISSPKPSGKSKIGWQLWNSENSTWTAVSHLKTVCVDENFAPCTTGRLRLAKTSSRSSHQDRRMGVYVITNRTHNLRPVYKHESQEEFLFHMNGAGKGMWLVGPEVGKFSGGLFVTDFALRPEFSFGTWIVFEKDHFEEDRGIKVSCKGIPSGEALSGMEENLARKRKGSGRDGRRDGRRSGAAATGRQNRNNLRRLLKMLKMKGSGECGSVCQNGGNCTRNDAGELQCICTGSYFGLRCETSVDCGDLPVVSGQQLVSTTGQYFLDVAFYRCPANTIFQGPPGGVGVGVVCQADGTWSEPPNCQDGPHLITPVHDPYSEERPEIPTILP